jgi:hypothetical protein
MTLETKIYIQNFSIEQINQVLNRIDIYFKTQCDHIELYSKEEGIFLIENGYFFQLKQMDKPIKYYKEFIEIKNALNNASFSLILDESYYEKTPVVSQIPVDYVSVPVTTFEFYNSPFLKFIVEGNKSSLYDCSRYETFTPLNFYFKTNEDIENYFVKEELNVFLSLFY